HGERVNRPRAGAGDHLRGGGGVVPCGEVPNLVELRQRPPSGPPQRLCPVPATNPPLFMRRLIPFEAACYGAGSLWKHSVDALAARLSSFRFLFWHSSKEARGGLRLPPYNNPNVKDFRGSERLGVTSLTPRDLLNLIRKQP